jgi:DNA-directed RNA polymerase specialized sigma24 family protein
MATTTSKPQVALIDQMDAEWRSLGRTRAAAQALEAVAARDPVLGALVHGAPGVPPRCPTPLDVLAHMRAASGRHQREEAAHIVRVLLREAGAAPFVTRMLVQALVPGLVTVAGKLRWGQGGEWQDASEFFAELLSTTWLVIQEWSGQDRPYAVLDLLSAVRCRQRRQLFRAKDASERSTSLGSGDGDGGDGGGDGEPATVGETGLEQLTKTLIGLHLEGMRLDEVQVLYAHHVLGYSIAELASVTGRDRRALYTRRDRGRRRLFAMTQAG